eukprot:TRINITY_DN1760_c0_g1_i2.p1 TRINITY_DN1760_c0_g1~~TRINITY_DN1760_c0_g1_i2.p1  ORF type:complete len:171 (-),score=29.09 TRINITY_DN1760_c0_g1_i2:990-1502(-)
MSDSPITQVNRVNLPITQVSREEPRDDSGVNSPRNSESGNEKPVKKRIPFFRRIFCCVSAPPEQEAQGASHDTTELQQSRGPFLQPPLPQFEKKITLVLDLDETLVHSSFKPVPNADFIIPVEIEGQVHQVYVLKRPFVDQFMKRMGDLYEVVVFTASFGKVCGSTLRSS